MAQGLPDTDDEAILMPVVESAMVRARLSLYVEIDNAVAPTVMVGLPVAVPKAIVTPAEVMDVEGPVELLAIVTPEALTCV